MTILEALTAIESKILSGVYYEKVKTEGSGLKLLDRFEIEPVKIKGEYKSLYNFEPVSMMPEFTEVEVLYRLGRYILQIISLKPFATVSLVWEEGDKDILSKFSEFKKIIGEKLERE